MHNSQKQTINFEKCTSNNILLKKKGVALVHRKYTRDVQKKKTNNNTNLRSKKSSKEEEAKPPITFI
jgi:hypothetical protein